MVMSEQIGFSRVSPMETFAQDAIRWDLHADVLRDATDLSKQLVAPADSIVCHVGVSMAMEVSPNRWFIMVYNEK